VQFLKKLAIASIALLAIFAAASEPLSWKNLIGLAVFGLIVYLARFDGGEDED
jgi:hypothetical protein